MTGTPINKRDRNTFWAFGADEDEQGYMSRYSFQESIRDKATLPLHFEAVDVKLHINKDAIDEAYSQMTDELSELDRDDLAKRAAKMAVLIKAPARVNAICQHIVKHFQEKVEPNGFKAQVVTFDRECCVLYKKAMDELVGPEASAIVMHTQGGKSDQYASFKLAKDEEEKLLGRFRDPIDPLKFLIVTSKLLTLAKEVVLAEKQVDPVNEQAKAKAALTELFAEVKNVDTPVVVERIVTDIEEIVRLVRFPGWQNTKAGEREVQKALRKVIYVKYKIKDQDLFDRAFGYIRQYY